VLGETLPFFAGTTNTEIPHGGMGVGRRDEGRWVGTHELIKKIAYRRLVVLKRKSCRFKAVRVSSPRLRVKREKELKGRPDDDPKVDDHHKP
jgi:hypothetical protein